MIRNYTTIKKHINQEDINNLNTYKKTFLLMSMKNDFKELVKNEFPKTANK